ncbi:MAG TPA: GDP-mannose 4,6-dehydratase [Candidatus Baltobacteraceae bacterium]|nr:GDP-mannose 4,6-dehydratase [Candidatus Baltobacteraceae bacterium]
MRALVTGGNGFVGRHLTAALRALGDDVVTAGHPHAGSEADLALELADLESVRAAVSAARAEVVFHLAAQTFVPDATRDPLRTYDVNVLGTARLYEALHEVYDARQAPRVVVTSSGEVYGAREGAELPLRESLAPRPATAYAAAKAGAEAIALAAGHTYGIPTIVTRAFNHIGPGQSERFAVAAFASGLAAIAAGGPARLPVGNLETQRDFLDVRDVVGAYLALAERGVPGEIYNVCSGRPVAIGEVLRQLITIAHVPVEVREDPARVRASDVPVAYGDNAKLRALTGWEPHYSLARSLRDVYADARERLGVAP